MPELPQIAVIACGGVLKTKCDEYRKISRIKILR